MGRRCVFLGAVGGGSVGGGRAGSRLGHCLLSSRRLCGRDYNFRFGAACRQGILGIGPLGVGGTLLAEGGGVGGAR